ncbi:MAG: hypothetical protein ABJN26_17975 [Stappiaceae bacterium]
MHFQKLFLTAFMIASFAMTGFAVAEDSYTITTSNGFEMTPQSKRAKIYMAGEKLLDFRNAEVEVRIEARKLGDAPTGETSSFGDRNTLMLFYANVEGKRTRISCNGGEEPQGWVKRTALTDTEVTGTFQVDMTSCKKSLSGENFTPDGLPIRIEGKFSVQRQCGPFPTC